MDYSDRHSPPGANGSNGSGSPPSQKRQRAKQACEPCRLRKRRCDGSMPCNMCTQFEYKCYFEKHPRKRSKLVEQHAHAELASATPPKDVLVENRQSGEEITKMRFLEANSGIAFTRLLGMRLDPSSGPKLFTFGWNLGTGYGPTLPSGPPITEFLSQEQMVTCANHYFESVHPIYGFLDKDWVVQGISQRWSDPRRCTVPDNILCGVASLGILYSTSNLNTLLPSLVEAQRRTLENTSTLRPPTLKDVQSWILRVLYLRSADHPHASWLASCTTMHLVEAVGLQQEVSSTVLHPAATEGHDDPEIRRRVFWVARMLNSWISFEYGRARVALRGITAALPTSTDGDYTTDYINLYSISCCLDPEQSDAAPQWEEFLAQLDAYEAPHPAIMLSKANLALCGYRRLRLANPTLSPPTITKIIRLGRQGLEAARRMAERRLPWWHVSNVPFQVICVFLAMDVREALAHLGTAMRTLEYVGDRFGTVAIKEVLKTARFLVRLSKKRKDEDSEALAASLAKDEPDVKIDVNQPITDATTIPAALSAATPLQAGGAPLQDTPVTVSSEDWGLDILNNSNFDWNFSEMPAFNGVAPDGTM